MGEMRDLEACKNVSQVYGAIIDIKCGNEHNSEVAKSTTSSIELLMFVSLENKVSLWSNEGYSVLNKTVSEIMAIGMTVFIGYRALEVGTQKWFLLHH